MGEWFLGGGDGEIQFGGLPFEKTKRFEWMLTIWILHYSTINMSIINKEPLRPQEPLITGHLKLGRRSGFKLIGYN